MMSNLQLQVFGLENHPAYKAKEKAAVLAAAEKQSQKRIEQTVYRWVPPKQNIVQMYAEKVREYCRGLRTSSKMIVNKKHFKNIMFFLVAKSSVILLLMPLNQFSSIIVWELLYNKEHQLLLNIKNHVFVAIFATLSLSLRLSSFFFSVLFDRG